MKILVTGGAGFIGSHVVERLVGAGDEVTVLDNLDPQVHGDQGPRNIEKLIAADSIRWIHGDVCNREALARALDGVEAVIHLAAVVGVGQSMYEPYYYVHNNGSGTGLLLELLAERSRQSRISRLVVASSMSLYGEGAYRCRACGGDEPAPRAEEDLQRGDWETRCARCSSQLTPLPTPESKRPDIASIYAATKKHQEELVVAFGRAYGVPSFALRFFNVYGPRQSLSNPYTGVAAIFLSRLINRREPLLFEDGLQSRDFIYVDDVADAVVASAHATVPDCHVVNVGTGRSVSILEVARTLATTLGVDIEPKRLGRYRAGDVRHCFADTARARALLGFEAKWRFEDGARRLVEWSRSERASDRVEASLKELEERLLVQ